MSIQLNLPQELESELSAEAEQLGLPLSEYVLRVLSSARLVGNPPRSGADLVEYWKSQGVIGTRPDITDSQQQARELRRQSEHRTRE